MSVKKSKENAENVVNPPSNPINRRNLPCSWNQIESARYPTTPPATPHPNKFTANVAQTDVVKGDSWATNKYLATAPTAPPLATSIRLTNMNYFRCMVGNVANSRVSLNGNFIVPMKESLQPHQFLEEFRTQTPPLLFQY